MGGRGAGPGGKPAPIPGTSPGAAHRQDGSARGRQSARAREGRAAAAGRGACGGPRRAPATLARARLTSMRLLARARLAIVLASLRSTRGARLSAQPSGW